MIPKIKTASVLGLPVAVTTREEAAQRAINWGSLKNRVYAIEAADVHVVTRARHEEDFGKTMREFDMICPDGMPVLWTVNRQLPEDQRMKERVSGAELMAEVFKQSEAESDCAHFLLGGSEELLAILPTKLAELAPKAKIGGVYSPPFGNWPKDEFERICDKIKNSGAKHVWVGLGCPKQERWIANNKKDLPPACYYGVGAAFAFHAGLIERAPSIFQKTGMEWFYRLCKEPRRLWKRYFTYNSLFLRLYSLN